MIKLAFHPLQPHFLQRYRSNHVIALIDFSFVFLARDFLKCTFTFTRWTFLFFQELRSHRIIQPILNSIRIIATIRIPAKTFLITVEDDRSVSLTPIKEPIIAPTPSGIAAANTIKPNAPAAVIGICTLK